MPCVCACLRFEQAPGLVVGSCRLCHPGPFLVSVPCVMLDIDVHKFSSRNGMRYDLLVFPGPFPRVLDHVLRKAGSCFFMRALCRACWAPEHDHVTLSSAGAGTSSQKYFSLNCRFDTLLSRSVEVFLFSTHCFTFISTRSKFPPDSRNNFLSSAPELSPI